MIVARFLSKTVDACLSGVFLAGFLTVFSSCEQGSGPPDAGDTVSEQAQGASKVVVDDEGLAWKQGPEIENQWPDDPKLDVARSLIRSRKFADAELVLGTLLQDRPGIGRARFLRGIAIQKQKRYEAALNDIDAAIATGQRFPEAAHAGHFRGWCFYHLGRLDAASEAFKAHAQAFPEEGDTQFGLGVVAIDQGRFEEAEFFLNRAIALQADLPERQRELAKAHARLGDVHLGLDRVDEARQSYHTAVIRWPDHYEAWAKLARTLDRLDRPVEAERARAEEANARRRTGRDIEEPAGPVGESGR
ncbi:MAG: tetratricopeptide repeat protein [Phycisphaerales bacterium]|nr:tetratricopeptide repeat protein [Phycisphaerales bacterium]